LDSDRCIKVLINDTWRTTRGETIQQLAAVDAMSGDAVPNGSSGNLSGLARALSHGNGLTNGASGPYVPKNILVREGSCD